MDDIFWWNFLTKVTKLPNSVNGEFSLVKATLKVVELFWWRKFYGAVNFVNGELVNGGGEVLFLEE